MTAAELVADATRRVVEATSADAEVVRDCIAHTVQVLLCEGLEPANDAPSELELREDLRIASMTQEEWGHEHDDGSSDVIGDSW